MFASLPAQPSISAYYYTNMRDFFVGLMFLVSMFLATYKGYDKIDMLVTSVTGVFAMGIALFPCYSAAFQSQKVGVFQIYPSSSNVIHLTCAAVFFVLLSLNSIFLFTKTGAGGLGPQKIKRNRIYVLCGIIMLFCVAAIGASMAFLSSEQVDKYRIVLVCETVALFFFGVSWLVKGQAIFADKTK